MSREKGQIEKKGVRGGEGKGITGVSHNGAGVGQERVEGRGRGGARLQGCGCR